MSDCLLSTIHISKYANSNKLFVLNSSGKDLKVQKKSLEKKIFGLLQSIDKRARRLSYTIFTHYQLLSVL